MIMLGFFSVISCFGVVFVDNACFKSQYKINCSSSDVYEENYDEAISEDFDVSDSDENEIIIISSTTEDFESVNKSKALTRKKLSKPSKTAKIYNILEKKDEKDKKKRKNNDEKAITAALKILASSIQKENQGDFFLISDDYSDM